MAKRISFEQRFTPDSREEFHRIVRDAGFGPLEYLVEQLSSLGIEASRSSVHRYITKYDTVIRATGPFENEDSVERRLKAIDAASRSLGICNMTELTQRADAILRWAYL